MEEEDVQCSRLLFKEDFLSTQYFGENQPASIITEKVHFGEGMHRRAFRTKLHTGRVPQLLPGDSCVLKVHNSISHGTKNNEELIQRNFNLAVEVTFIVIIQFFTSEQQNDGFPSIAVIIWIITQNSDRISYFHQE